MSPCCGPHTLGACSAQANVSEAKQQARGEMIPEGTFLAPSPRALPRDPRPEPPHLTSAKGLPSIPCLALRHSFARCLATPGPHQGWAHTGASPRNQARPTHYPAQPSPAVPGEICTLQPESCWILLICSPPLPMTAGGRRCGGCRAGLDATGRAGGWDSSLPGSPAQGSPPGPQGPALTQAHHAIWDPVFLRH